MSQLVYLVLVLLLISSVHIANAVECVIPNESPVRIFDTLTAYQANNIPFRPGKLGWQGSTISFRFPVGHLQKNAFISFDSESLIVLKLDQKYIRKIDDGAFVSLLCLNELFLDHNNITKLSKYTFKGLFKLRKLDLSYNSIETLPDIGFLDCPKLESLNLAWNRIRIIESLSFLNATNLKYLNLEHNQIETIADGLFAPLVNLEMLSLGWNKLDGVELGKWDGLKRLQNLDLGGNKLRRFDPNYYNFSFYELENLNLSNNRLAQLNVVAIKRHLPRLKLIDLDDNEWFCDDLDKVMVQLNVSNIRVAARNFSTVGIRGVSCTDVLVLSTTSSTSRSTAKRMVDKQYLEDFVKKKLEDNNREISSEISSVRTLIIVVATVLGGCFIVVQILLSTNCCRNRVERLRGGDQQVHFDNNDVENFRLLNR